MECAFLVFFACVGLWFIEECVVLRLCWYIVYRMRNVWLCTGVGLWFIERGILRLECTFLCFLRLCWFVVYRTRNSWSAPFLVFALVLVYGL